MSIANSIGAYLAGRWVSGITVDDVIADAKRFNANGEKVMINCLGEGLKNIDMVSNDKRIYLELLKAMKAAGITGCIAIKPTQIGLCIGYRAFFRNYIDIIKAAKEMGVFVWTDMEEHVYIDDTLKAYLEALKDHDNVGICIQARLRRSLDDIKLIAKRGGVVRLVKGAYGKHRGITYMNKRGTDLNYVKCMDYLFKHSTAFMVATHDSMIIDTALDTQRRYRRKLMFAMLKGIRPKLAKKLADSGNEVYIYLPFGEQWFKYSMRRLKELEHVVLVLRSIIQG